MRKTIGLTEFVTLYGKKKKRIKARIDTGATKSSMDHSLARELGLGPITRKRKVKSAYSSTLRPLIECMFSMKGEKAKVEFTLAERGHMKYQILIGQNALKSLPFLIDPRSP